MSQPVLKAETNWSQPSSVASARESILAALKEAGDEGPGDYLRQLREIAKLEVKEVATQLGLNKDQVIAIEANNFEALPAPIYLKGFYRRYCSLLAIESDAVLSSYEQSHADANPELNRVTISQNRNPVSFRFFGYMITILLVVGVLYFLKDVDFSGLWTTVTGDAQVESTENTATELSLPVIKEVPLEEPQKAGQ
ncbi:MAG: helix-turn-helix domain-containing protein [Gammaproteobacteria bacterium]|nr:helix-turn-helix domain-containing protein [Gammaproteobacteria bacterium]